MHGNYPTDMLPTSHTSRHAAYVGHPEAEGYNKHLLTLLAQRRELQTDDVRRLLSEAAATQHSNASASAADGSSEGPGGQSPLGYHLPLPASLFATAATAASIERERQELQQELALGLKAGCRPTMVEACRAAVQGAGKPLAGGRPRSHFGNTQPT